MNPKVRESITILMMKNDSTVDFLQEWLDKKKWNSMEAIGVASVVANVYNGIETVLELLVRKVHGITISGAEFHKTLLTTADDLGYIPIDIISIMSGMRDFRHFKRHGYDIELEPDQVRAYAPQAIVAHRAVAGRILEKHPELREE